MVLSATDLCDSDPAISAHLAPLGVGVEDEIDVRYKRKRTNSIKVQVKRQGIRVTLEGPEQAALEGLWQAAVERGGFAVEDDQVIKLDRGGRGGSRDGDSSGGKRRRTLKFKFDADLKLTEAHVPAPILVAQSTDTSGNQSSVVEVGTSHSGLQGGFVGSPQHKSIEIITPNDFPDDIRAVQDARRLLGCPQWPPKKRVNI